MHFNLLVVSHILDTFSDYTVFFVYNLLFTSMVMNGEGWGGGSGDPPCLGAAIGPPLLLMSNGCRGFQASGRSSITPSTQV